MTTRYIEHMHTNEPVTPGRSVLTCWRASGRRSWENPMVSWPGDENICRIVVINDYQWMGSPAAGGFVVYLDGKRAGVAPLGATCSMQVASGAHVLRIRLRYYLSPRVKLDLRPGETRRFSADIPRKVRVWWRILRGIADPFHSLSLEEVTGP